MPGASSYLVVRYDDYCPRDPLGAGQVGIELERRLFELFHAHDARLLVGVVPFPTAHGTSARRAHEDAPLTRNWLEQPDDPWVALLRRYADLGFVVPALHGYSHLRRTPARHRPAEFVGQPYDWQYQKIRAGRDALRTALGIPIRTFVPPWNGWDTNTSRALGELGFEWLSADLHHAVSTAMAVRRVPQCSSAPNEVLELLRTDHQIPSGSIVVLVTHPFDFEGADGEAYFRSLEQLLEFVRADPNWACVGLSDLPEASPSEWNERFRRAVRWEHIQCFLQDSVGPPWLLRPRPTAYRPLEWYRAHTLPWQVAVAVTLIVSAAAGWLLSRLVARRVLRSRRFLWAAAVLATTALIVLILGAVAIADRGYGIRGVRWQAVAIATGATLALAWVGFRDARRSPTKLVLSSKECE
jgi:hypothetical protein